MYLLRVVFGAKRFLTNLCSTKGRGILLAGLREWLWYLLPWEIRAEWERQKSGAKSQTPFGDAAPTETARRYHKEKARAERKKDWETRSTFNKINKEFRESSGRSEKTPQKPSLRVHRIRMRNALLMLDRKVLRRHQSRRDSRKLSHLLPQAMTFGIGLGLKRRKNGNVVNRTKIAPKSLPASRLLDRKRRKPIRAGVILRHPSSLDNPIKLRIKGEKMVGRQIKVGQNLRALMPKNR